MIRRTALVLPLTAGLLLACGGSAPPGLDPLPIGPCVHVYQDEVLHLVEALGQPGDVPLAQVELRAVAVNDQPRSADTLLAGRHRQIEARDDHLLCTLPCSFGIENGRWTFTATAPGYGPSPQAVDAAYARFTGGCPSSDDEGTRASLQLHARP